MFQCVTVEVFEHCYGIWNMKPIEEALDRPRAAFLAHINKHCQKY